MAIQRNQIGKSGEEVTDTYRISVLAKIWWTLYLLASVSIICVSIYFLLFAVGQSNFWIAAAFIIPVIALGVLAFSSIKYLTMRLTITNSDISSYSIWGTMQMTFQNVKGFRVVSTAQRSDIGLPGWEVEIESLDGVVITAPKSIENQDQLIDFLKSRFKELDEHK
jgi:hypothetical protein